MSIETPPRPRLARRQAAAAAEVALAATPARPAALAGTAGSAGGHRESAPLPPRLPSRRNPRWIALGLVAVCLGGLLSWFVYSEVAEQTSVVVVTQTVRRGETIERSDLASVSLSRAAAVSSVPATAIPDLIGQIALVDLVSGALLPRDAIGSTPLPAQGRAVVGLKLAYGRVPSGLLPPSTPVRLVTLPDESARSEAETTSSSGSKDSSATGPVTYLGRVVDYADASDGASVIVNVDVAAADAPAISVLAATDRLAVLRDAE